MPPALEVKPIRMTAQQRDAAYEAVSEQEWQATESFLLVAIGRPSDQGRFRILDGMRENSAAALTALTSRMEAGINYFIAPHKYHDNRLAGDNGA